MEPYRNMSEETRFINKPRFCCVACSAVIVSPNQPSWWCRRSKRVTRTTNTGVARRDGQQVVQWKGRKGFVSIVHPLDVSPTLVLCLVSCIRRSMSASVPRKTASCSPAPTPYVYPPLPSYLHTTFSSQVADVYCISCSARLGWTYLKVSLPL